MGGKPRKKPVVADVELKCMMAAVIAAGMYGFSGGVNWGAGVESCAVRSAREIYSQIVCDEDAEGIPF